MTNELLRPLQYQKTVIQVEAARHGFEAAARILDIARIQERNAELASQSFEYAAKGGLQKRFGGISDREREIGIAFARYATYGRAD